MTVFKRLPIAEVKSYAFVILAAITMLGDAGCASSTPAAPQTPAEGLATIQLGHAPGPDNAAMVAAFQNVLADINPKCAGDETHVAAQINATHAVLENDGYSQGLLAIARGFDTSLSKVSFGPSFNCAQIGAALVVLMEH